MNPLPSKPHCFLCYFLMKQITYLLKKMMPHLYCFLHLNLVSFFLSLSLSFLCTNSYSFICPLSIALNINIYSWTVFAWVFEFQFIFWFSSKVSTTFDNFNWIICCCMSLMLLQHQGRTIILTYFIRSVRTNIKRANDYSRQAQLNRKVVAFALATTHQLILVKLFPLDICL